MPSDKLHPQLAADFRNFLYAVWKFLGLPDPTPIQYDIAAYLQQAPERAMVQGFRGVGKSYILAAYCVWRLAQDPNIKIMMVSAGAGLAADTSQLMLRIIENMPAVMFLRPKVDDRQSVLSFDVGPSNTAKDPSVFAIGLSGQMTGHRAHLLISDDIETPKTAETVGQRDKLLERSREFEALLVPGGQIIYLGTPQCVDTMYASLPDRGYEVKLWPAQVPTKNQLAGYGTSLGPLVQEMVDSGVPVGTPTDPLRFDEVELEKRRLAYGPAGYALQYMLDPTLSDTDKYPLKLRDLLVMPIDPAGVPQKLLWSPTADRHAEELPNVGIRGDRIYRALVLPADELERHPLTGIVMAIDPSGRGADETGYAIGAARGGFVWLLDAGGVPGVSDHDLDHLCVLMRRWDVTAVVAEPNYGGGMFVNVMEAALQRNKLRASISDSKWATGRKEKRIIETLYPLIAGHRLVVHSDLFIKDANSVSHLTVEKGLPRRLFHQLTHLTDKPGCLVHDDRLEAVAILCQHFAEHAAVDQHRAEQKEREEAWERALQEFERAVGIATPGSRRNLRR